MCICSVQMVHVRRPPYIYEVQEYSVYRTVPGASTVFWLVVPGALTLITYLSERPPDVPTSGFYLDKTNCSKGQNHESLWNGTNEWIRTVLTEWGICGVSGGADYCTIKVMVLVSTAFSARSWMQSDASTHFGSRYLPQNSLCSWL